ncbi:M15 family metallopeptidase [Nocardioides sp. zg-DK7169]|uniref:M15 family metallopeptidase n=1 Tax=Nocardioides sp. zg-DK7169 TaxID=2736600 RepID=UPI0015519E8A|nr:M15 family metallopeptidase [Nocardioides sp. zg-DK7169]NPC97561.1 M15 family metallopeptidase [Nocardioides sp. zg-DK7169]
MPLGSRMLSSLLATTGVLTGVVVSAPDARALDPAPVTLALEAPRAVAGEVSDVSLSLGTDTGPVLAASVRVERRVGGEWSPLTTVVTDDTGHAVVPLRLRKVAADNVVRASWSGDETYGPARATLTVRLRRLTSRLVVRAPARVVDEQQVRVEVRWRAGGRPVAGRVQVLRRDAGGPWRAVRWVRTGGKGAASLVVRPRVDTAWRAKAPAVDWATRATSKVRRIDNVPPGTPVSLPAAAPKPRVSLPRQQRAIGTGPNPVVTTIPDGVWRTMTGRSWHAGCPVGRGGLRLLRINYWGYDGYRYRGELVANADSVGRMSAALASMYRRELPLRSMYRVDRFGWSKRLNGADDYASMAAGNTSAFNCRHVVGRPGVRSPHSYGRSLDVNPWENPYRASHGWTPNSWWVGRSHPRVAWRSSGHQVVRLMASHGLRWTYGTSDAHHFDATPGGAAGRLLTPAELHPQCDGFVCK